VVNLVYTQHARDRMTQRGVTEADVQATLANYHTTYTDPNGNRNYVGYCRGRRVRIVVVGDGRADPAVIKTVIAD
jgi:hypothetical protein